MNMNLIMAVVWCTVAVGWWATTAAKGDVLPVVHFGGVQFSPAWLALLLCLYNIVRWWLRPRRGDLYSLSAALQERRRRHSLEAKPREPSDPQFNFTDRPPDAPPNGTPVE